MPGPLQSVYIPVPTAMGQMIANMQAQNSPLTDFTEGSGARTVCEAFAIVASGQSQVADELQKDSFLETATGEALDAQGSNWQVKRLPAVQATGTVSITRQSTSGALVIPAGWAQLTVPPATPGGEGVAVITLENAEFAEGEATVTVTAQAVIGGTAGNLSAGTVLTPLNPIGGVSSQEGFKVASNFTGGVNVETDAAYRKRIPIVVQGRVKGRKSSFEGAALSVPGVQSVGVLRAGTLRSNATEVPASHVEVVYQGSAGLLNAVTSACEEAATVNQNVTVQAGVSLGGPRGQQRIVFEATIFFAPGANGATLKAAAVKTAIEFVEAVGCGNTLYASELIEAIHQNPEVVSITIPLTKLCLFGESTAGNITMFPDQYPHLAEADCVITATEL
jgi:uncharacterized phage protein gp47/JayE